MTRLGRLWAAFCHLPRALQWGVVVVVGVAVAGIAMVAGGTAGDDPTRPVAAGDRPITTVRPTTTSFPASSLPAGVDVTVASVSEGDVFTTTDGTLVRLLGIDAPGAAECMAEEATSQLRRLLPTGQRVRLVYDQTRQDAEGRDLAYVYRLDDGLMVNVEMAREGWATELAEQPDVRHVGDIAAAALSAREAGRGIWGACPGGRQAEASTGPATTGPAATGPATTNPSRPTTRPAASPSTLEVVPTEPGDECAPGYPSFCIAPPPPDVDCDVMPFANFPVSPPDPHGFDPDGDGIGCES